ncbi:hypothetical protein pipiens_009196 [Culex pipiens pipiens]|uniref:Neurite outgrowth-associated protein n=1 Tax=Culex pipiens pipiens TaxID=38569 RepID=A0ABD1DEP1_CULPP
MLRTILKLADTKQKVLLARNYVRRARNPGVDRQMGLLNDDQLKTDLEELEQIDEVDFSGVAKSHRQYEKETQQYRERLQSWIVGNKYFKTKQLNFLTWSEKEQIRYLHNFDPEEWTIDKLVESFPADRYTVAKIVKAKWTPRDAGRVQRHDETVRENWEMLKSGRIKNIDDGFAEHLNKFVHRNFQEVQRPKVETKRLYEIQQLPEGGEFSQIITSCKKYADTPVDEQKLLGEEQRAASTPDIPFRAPNDDMFLMAVEEPQSQMINTVLAERIEELKVQKHETGAVPLPEFRGTSAARSEIREFVKIPKKLYRKGATYQLDDCFYDDDGEFLYRVPGMAGRSGR